jgi:hypothetical protein
VPWKSRTQPIPVQSSWPHQPLRNGLYDEFLACRTLISIALGARILSECSLSIKSCSSPQRSSNFNLCFFPTSRVKRFNTKSFHMAMPYSQIPANATKQPSPFQISIPEAKLTDFKALLKLSKVTPPTYESLQEDRRFGVGHKWITDTKKYWEETFDW